MNYELPPQPMKETEPPQSILNVVFIRKPHHIKRTGAEFRHFKLALEAKNFAVVLVPEPEDDPSDKWYPTDTFRQVGARTIIGPLANSYLEEALQETQLLPHTTPQFVNSLETPLVGGDYVYQSRLKVFVYAKDKVVLVGPERGTPEYESLKNYYAQYGQLMPHDQLDKFLDLLTQEGWTILTTEVSDLEPVPFTSGNEYRVNDLDFHLSLFLGKDNQLHALVAEVFADRVPDAIAPQHTHIIPTNEVIQGGCNVADLDNGKVLVSPNRINTPTTWQVLQEYAQADIIEAPPDFLEGGGGPRCSISAATVELRTAKRSRRG